MFRIGGDMELEVTLLLAPKQRDNLSEFAFYKEAIWTDIGRVAISLALEDIILRGGEKIAYLPSFVCDAVKQPFIEKHFEIRFYSMGEDLIEPKDLPINITNKVFLYVHYFGMYNEQIVNWLQQKRKEQQFFAIEDCAQAAFNQFKSGADYTIYSFRKFTPQPDGALLLSTEPFMKNYSLESPNNEFLIRQVNGKLMRARTNNSECFLEDLKNSESSLDDKVVPRKMSDIATYIMTRLEIEKIKQYRKDNWRRLSKELTRLDVLKRFIQPLYKGLNKEEVPLGFPVIIRGNLRDRLRSYLIQQDIFCPVHWPMKEFIYKEDAFLTQNILTLPIDQRMGTDEIKYLVDCLVNFFEGVDGK